MFILVFIFLLYDVDDCYLLVAYKIIGVPIVLGYDQMRLFLAAIMHFFHS